jgi:subtilase family serine protease
MADNCTTGCDGYGWAGGGRTSAAAPLMAGGIALADEQASSHGEAPLGLVNPLLYQLGAAHSAAFVNISMGNNDIYALGCCTAKSGHNEADGWGSIVLPIHAATHDHGLVDLGPDHCARYLHLGRRIGRRRARGG